MFTNMTNLDEARTRSIQAYVAAVCRLDGWLVAPALFAGVVGVNNFDVVADVSQVCPSSSFRSSESIPSVLFNYCAPALLSRTPAVCSTDWSQSCSSTTWSSLIRKIHLLAFILDTSCERFSFGSSISSPAISRLSNSSPIRSIIFRSIHFLRLLYTWFVVFLSCVWRPAFQRCRSDSECLSISFCCRSS